MNFYNIFKGEIYTSSFSKDDIVKKYSKQSTMSDIEEVYYRKDLSDAKYLIIINDEDIGKKVYNILDKLKYEKINFDVSNYFKSVMLTIDKTIVNRRTKQVYAFYLTISNFLLIDNVYDRLKYLVSLIEELLNLGYCFDEKNFDITKCCGLAGVLSNMHKSNTKYNSKNRIIEIIHYILSGKKELNEEFNKITKKNFLCLDDVNYHFKLFKLFYMHYKDNEININLNKYLETLEYEFETDNVGIPSRLDNYNSYKYNTKGYYMTTYVMLKDIYGEINSGCNERFRIYSKPDLFNDDILYEKSEIESATNTVIQGIVLDIDGNRIGYKYSKENKERLRLSERKFYSQKAVVMFFSKLKKKFEKYFYKFDSPERLDLACVHEDIEDYLVYEDDIVFESIDMYIDRDKEKNVEFGYSILNLFFLKYKELLESKYGDIGSTRNEIMQKIEVKLLPSLLAEHFIDYIQRGRVSYDSEAIEVLSKYLDYVGDDWKINKISSITDEYIFIKDIYNFYPEEVKITFDYEIKDSSLKLNRSRTLPDGRRYIKVKDVSDLCKYLSSQELNIEMLNDIFTKKDLEGIEYFKITEVIYSPEIDNGYGIELAGYKPIGIIVSTKESELLTLEYISKLSNKDFIKLAIKLFKIFNERNIDFDYIYIDKDFNIYIDIVTKGELIIGRTRNHFFIGQLFDDLEYHFGYDRERFSDINFYCDEDVLIRTMEKMKGYCQEHNQYYKTESNGHCCLCEKTRYYFSDDTNFDKYPMIYEDEYAKHYSLDKEYNLKIYKEDVVDLDEMNNIVGEIVARKLEGNKKLFGQDLFIPIKKAMFQEKFIGYIYEKTTFNVESEGDNYCINIRDTEKISNLVRIKACLRLITQYKNLAKNNIGMLKPTVKDVFLSKGHNFQVQFLNPEFFVSKELAYIDKEYIGKYVVDTISLDNNYDLKLEGNYCEFIYDNISNYSKLLTKYCSTHKYYYNEKQLACPKCLDIDKQTSILENSIIVSKNQIAKWEQINEGGEANIFRYTKKKVAKIFKEDETDNDFKLNLLMRIFKRKDTLTKMNKGNIKYIIPEKLIIDKDTNKVIGYIMDMVDNGISIYTLRDKNEVKKLQFTGKDVLDILITTGQGIEELHSKVNIFIGDLNGRNILFDKEKNVYFIDFDGMGIDDISPVFYTDGYVDPISKNNKCITMKDDWYSFAIQAFYYLTYTHPFNGIYKDNERTLDLLEKMEKKISLVGNHNMRVPEVARDWSWMSDELKNAFLNIFEGDSRESIVPLLIEEQKRVFNLNFEIEQSNSEKVISSDFKWEIIQLNISDKNKYANITDKVCTYLDGGKRVIEFNTSKGVYYKITQINKKPFDTVISSNENYAFIIRYTKNIYYCIDICRLSTGELIETVEDIQIYSIYENTLFYIKNDILHSIELDGEEPILKEVEHIKIDAPVMALGIKNKLKMILVKKYDAYKDAIYCNNKFLVSIDKAQKYIVRYDKYTDRWIVFNDNGECLVILPNGEFELNTEDMIDQINLDRVVFYKGNVYLPFSDKLRIFNTKSNIEKEIECDNIIDKDSKIIINNDGFTSIKNGKTYRYILK